MGALIFTVQETYFMHYFVEGKFSVSPPLFPALITAIATGQKLLDGTVVSHEDGWW